MLTLGEKSLPHQGLEPTSVLHLAFRSDAIPTELPLPQDKTAREFSPRVSSECRLSYSVHAHPVCNHTPSVPSVKRPKPLAAIPLFGHMKTQHTLHQPLKDGARLPELQGN